MTDVDCIVRCDALAKKELQDSRLSGQTQNLTLFGRSAKLIRHDTTVRRCALFQQCCQLDFHLCHVTRFHQ